AFWIAPASPPMKRLDPRTINGATSRMLLVVDDPDTVTAQAVREGANETSPVGDEHGWRLGRIIDPFGHEWEIGRPLGPWPPPGAGSRAFAPRKLIDGSARDRPPPKLEPARRRRSPPRLGPPAEVRRSLKVPFKRRPMRLARAPR